MIKVEKSENLPLTWFVLGEKAGWIPQVPVSTAHPIRTFILRTIEMMIEELDIQIAGEPSPFLEEQIHHGVSFLVLESAWYNKMGLLLRARSGPAV